MKVAVDAVVINIKDSSVLLIKRKYPPLGWALPGGFVEENESVVEALRRELMEETGLTPFLTPKIIEVYSEPSRDPRGRVISVAYVVIVNDVDDLAQAGDDALECKWFEIIDLPKDLVFDHDIIVRAGIEKVFPGALG